MAELREFLPAEDSTNDVLMDRVLVAMMLTHNHPGLAGVPEGSGCLRCNAERALNTLVGRAKGIV